jgi:hypothetical protein
VCEDDREVDGIDAHRAERGREDRQNEKQRRSYFEKAAEHEKQGIDRQQKLPGREVMAEQEFDKTRGGT